MKENKKGGIKGKRQRFSEKTGKQNKNGTRNINNTNNRNNQNRQKPVVERRTKRTAKPQNR